MNRAAQQPHHCPRCGYPGKDKRAKKGGAKRWSGTTSAQRSAAMRKVRKGGKGDDVVRLGDA